MGGGVSFQCRCAQTYQGKPFLVNMRHLLPDMPHHETWDKPKDAWQVPYCPDKNIKKVKTFQKLNLSGTKWIPEDPCGKKKDLFGIEQP